MFDRKSLRFVFAMLLSMILVLSILPAAFVQGQPQRQDSPMPSPTPLPVPPPNDDFDDATVIGALPFTDNLDTTQATWAGDDPTDCTSNGSVWYAFTPSADMAIEANTFGSNYDTVLSVYTGSRGALNQVPGACNDDYNGLQSRVVFNANAGTTYFFLVGFCCGHGGDGGGQLAFQVQEIIAPPNDDFVNATSISQLRFRDTVDTSGASLEPGEPTPSCGYDIGHTIWYAFTPTQSGSYSAYTENAWFSRFIAAYTGDELSGLIEQGCRDWGGMLTLRMDAGTTYYFQAGGLYHESGQLTFNLDIAPQPEANFYFYPDQPSMFDTVWFYDGSWDPGDVGFQSQEWDFGDGTTATGCCPSHQFAADVDYTVQLTVTTWDGRTASTSRVVSVRTHDVAITKFSVPNAGKANQTRRIIVGVNSKRYPERVEVVLYKSVPGGFEWVGSSIQSVPVRRSNRTTNFSFNYTFTRSDALVGKVTFKAQANLIDASDALPADNEAISAPIKVK